ncbi:putative protein NEDD1 [Paratrimastix pyriformis]|uniref:Uncharacterized protein n=1 Tax=Paratrimastix pyriformis TaxID=342808 RepID=A0ABQ8U576_9EUKA|nr:putative protein NEDD1 [Paratrimastix pyriformis]
MSRNLGGIPEKQRNLLVFRVIPKPTSPWAPFFIFVVIPIILLAILLDLILRLIRHSTASAQAPCRSTLHSPAHCPPVLPFALGRDNPLGDGYYHGASPLIGCSRVASPALDMPPPPPGASEPPLSPWPRPLPPWTGPTRSAFWGPTRPTRWGVVPPQTPRDDRAPGTSYQVAVVCDSEGTVALIHHKSGAVLNRLRAWTDEARGVPESLSTLSFSSGSRYLGTGGASSLVKIWDMKTKAVVKTLRGHTAPISAMAYYGEHFATGSERGDVIAHNYKLETFDTLQQSATPGSAIRDLQYSVLLKGRLLAGAADDGAVHLWDVHTRREQALFKKLQAPAPLTALSFHDDGYRLAVGTLAGALYLCDLRYSNREWRCLCPETGHAHGGLIRALPSFWSMGGLGASSLHAVGSTLPLIPPESLAPVQPLSGPGPIAPAAPGVMVAGTTGGATVGLASTAPIPAVKGLMTAAPSPPSDQISSIVFP